MKEKEPLSYLDLYRMLDAVWPVISALPEVTLLPGQRMALSGRLFPGDDFFVRLVAGALAGAPQHFRDVPCCPQEMAARLDRSDGFLTLHLLFQDLAQRCWDLYVLDRATAIQDAYDVVHQVRAEGQVPFPPAGHETRRRALRPAEHALAKRARRNHRVAQKRREAAERGPQRSPKRGRRSPQARAIREAARAPDLRGALPPPPAQRRRTPRS